MRVYDRMGWIEIAAKLDEDKDRTTYSKNIKNILKIPTIPPYHIEPMLLLEWKIVKCLVQGNNGKELIDAHSLARRTASIVWILTQTDAVAAYAHCVGLNPTNAILIFKK